MKVIVNGTDHRGGDILTHRTLMVECPEGIADAFEPTEEPFDLDACIEEALLERHE